MGGVCAKGISKSELVEIKKERRAARSLKRLVTPSKSKREAVTVADDAEAGVRKDGSRARLIAEPEEVALTPTALLLLEEGEKEVAVAVERSRKENGHARRGTAGSVEALPERGLEPVAVEPPRKLEIVSLPNGFEGGHVAPVWPSWLTTVAGDAVKGWMPRRAESFEKLDKIGQGTYSSVYKARDLETGKIVALKKVRFVNKDPESVRFMAREIYILRRLNHPNVVKLEGLVTSLRSTTLYLVFEYMEHDLAGLAATPGIKFSEPQVKCYMQQLLSGLDHCHSRGVLHRDIKGSNLLIDNNGILKIADFGLATFFNPDQKQQLTSRVVTLWYRPPELLLGATEYGVAVDLWSAGCILAELLIGKPIMPGRTEVEQLHKIFKLCGSPSEEFWSKSKLPHATIFKPQHPYRRCVVEMFKDFPSPALSLVDRLLAIEPADRGSAASALNNEFFTTIPLPCDPSSLPKYAPSKEFDAKLRDEEARRQRKAAIKGHGSESGRRPPKESEVAELPDAFEGLQKHPSQANPASRRYKHNPQDDRGPGFPVTHHKDSAESGFSHSGRPGPSGWKIKDDVLQDRGPSTALGRPTGPEYRTERPRLPQTASTNNLPGLGQARNTNGMSDAHREKAKHPNWPEHRMIPKYNHLDVADASEKQEWFHHLLDRPASSHRKDDRAGGKEPTTGYGAKKNRIHYSGPLMPPGGNMDEMLKEHERQIQQAVRKARIDKTKTRNYNGKGHLSEALLYRSRNGRSDA